MGECAAAAWQRASSQPNAARTKDLMSRSLCQKRKERNLWLHAENWPDALPGLPDLRPCGRGEILGEGNASHPAVPWLFHVVRQPGAGRDCVRRVLSTARSLPLARETAKRLCAGPLR